MSDPTKQDDHQQEALDLLPGQFEDSTSLQALIGAMVGPADPATHAVQELENVLWDVLQNRWLPTATGKQLDKLGEILGETRLTDDDEEYRLALYLRVTINTSKGEAERLIDILQILTGAGAIHFIGKWPARARLCAIGITKADLLDRVQEAAAGGVAIIITAGGDEEPFIYGRARDASGTQHGVQHPQGGLGYGVPGQADTGGKYTAIFVHVP